MIGLIQNSVNMGFKGLKNSSFNVKYWRLLICSKVFRCVMHHVIFSGTQLSIGSKESQSALLKKNSQSFLVLHLLLNQVIQAPIKPPTVSCRENRNIFYCYQLRSIEFWPLKSFFFLAEIPVFCRVEKTLNILLLCSRL